ncbi:hypothetical protein ACLMJK_003711 [Lecanora helva]
MAQFIKNIVVVLLFFFSIVRASTRYTFSNNNIHNSSQTTTTSIIAVATPPTATVAIVFDPAAAADAHQSKQSSLANKKPSHIRSLNNSTKSFPAVTTRKASPTASHPPTPAVFKYHNPTVPPLPFPLRSPSSSSSSTRQILRCPHENVSDRNKTLHPFQEPQGLVTTKAWTSTVLDVMELCSRVLNTVLTLYNIRVTVRALAKLSRSRHATRL